MDPWLFDSIDSTLKTGITRGFPLHETELKFLNLNEILINNYRNDFKVSSTVARIIRWQNYGKYTVWARIRHIALGVLKSNAEACNILEVFSFDSSDSCLIISSCDRFREPSYETCFISFYVFLRYQRRCDIKSYRMTFPVVIDRLIPAI